MSFVKRDGNGDIVTVYGGPQPGQDLEEIPRDHPDLVALRAARDAARTPIEIAKNRAQNDPLLVAVVKVMADLHAETPAQMRQRIVDKLV